MTHFIKQFEESGGLFIFFVTSSNKLSIEKNVPNVLKTILNASAKRAYSSIGSLNSGNA